MTTHVVVSLYLSGKKNKVWKSGDKVSASDFENFDKLLSGGYIKKIESGQQEAVKESSNDDKEPLFVIDRDGEPHNVFEEADVTKAELVSLLEEKKVEFDKTSKKSVLWDLLTA